MQRREVEAMVEGVQAKAYGLSRVTGDAVTSTPITFRVPAIRGLLMAPFPQELVWQSVLLLAVAGISFQLWRALKPRNRHSLRSVAIVVLGDIGRSPRMMYHAQSFAETGFITDIIGYGGSTSHTQCS